MHRSGRVGWLRAAVLGSDDAIVSTASLMIGVAAASATKSAVLVAGVAGLVAGAMSMAVGEYVSVSSQRDAEQADIGLETLEARHHRREHCGRVHALQRQRMPGARGEQGQISELRAPIAVAERVDRVQFGEKLRP